MTQQFIGTSRHAQGTAGKIMNANFSELYMRAQTDVLDATTADTTFVVPAGFIIEHIAFFNTTANAVTGGFKVGVATGATDVVAAQPVAANAVGVVPGANVLQRIFSTTVDTTLHLAAVTAWNSASVNFRILLRKAF